jgi:ribonuclease Z
LDAGASYTGEFAAIPPTLVHKDLSIEGYSRAAVQTYWRVPELKVGFDLGAQPWAFMATRNWFVSHGHLDHVAALPGWCHSSRAAKSSYRANTW